MSHPRASSTTELEAVDVTDDGGTALKTIDREEPYLSGHYPGNPIYPGVFLFDLCEKLASSCPAIPRPFDRLDSLRFFAPALPGDRVRIELTLRRSAAGTVIGAAFLGRSTVEDQQKLFTVRMSYA